MLRQVLFTCNPLFFLLSGKLNIKERDERGIITFYKAKVRNILIPTLIFFFLYAIFLNYESGSVLAILKGFVKGTISEYSSSPYWFMFTPIGFLAFALFLGRAFRDLKMTHLVCFAVICLGYNNLSVLRQ